MNRIKIDRNGSESVIRITLKNIPLLAFYLIVIALLWTFLSQFDRIVNDILGNDYRIGAGVFLTFILLFYVIRSILGEAIVTIRGGVVTTYEGVFGIGRRKELLVSQLEDIYISRSVSGGGTDAGRPNPMEIKQHIVFKTHKKVKFLHNQISSHDLKEVCKVLRSELLGEE